MPTDVTCSCIMMGSLGVTERGQDMDGLYATNFLLFTAMGVSEKSCKEAIVNAAMDRAFRDASSHVLSIDGGNEPKRKEGKGAISEALEKLEPFDDYAEWHDSLCQKLRDNDYSPGNEHPLKAITYGIAQKWVNMTMKYLAIAYYAFNEHESCKDYCDFYERVVKHHEADLHVPVDRYIIEAAWRKSSDIKLPVNDPGKRTNEYKHPADYCTAWSKWNEEDYKQFQKTLRGALGREDALDWEGSAWIEAADHSSSQNH